MAQSIIGEKSLAFAKRIAKSYVYLKKKGETVMSKQLLRCGTSVGANVREGHYAQSKKDFISKMNRRPSERRAKLAWAIPSEKEVDEVKSVRNKKQIREK